MKILHCCLANFYADGYAYQENVLPQIHKKLGHDVKIIASTETYVNNRTIGYVPANTYLSQDDIPIARLAYIKGIPDCISKRVRIYHGLYWQLTNYRPDIIFLHGFQFIGILEIAKYAKHYPVTIVADCHTDFMNSAKTWVSRYILHKIIYRWCAKRIEPFVAKFWGVTPSRKRFLTDFYGISPKKVGLLVMGIDDSAISYAERQSKRSDIRSRLNFTDDDFVLISGGKIGKRKNINLLLRAFNELNNSNIKLLLFGSIDNNVKSEFAQLKDNPNICYIGWQQPEDIYDLFVAADLGIFPGTHSVLWEQAVGLGLPSIFKSWEGYEHIDVGGNCVFVHNDSADVLRDYISDIYRDKARYATMKKISEEIGPSVFSYTRIAKQSIYL